MTNSRTPLHRSLAGLLIFCLLISTIGARQFDLPDFGSSADLVMTPTDERRLGQAFMRSVQDALPVIDDPLLTDYIEELGRGLVAASDNASGRYTFFLIDEPVINAFAGPDGIIGVYAGLILAAESEAELAAVMAHEIAHVTQRHLFRSIEDQQRLSLPTTALLIAAAILGAQISPDAGLAAVAGLQAASAQHQVNFTRDNEKEADRIGIGTLAGAGHDPFAMAGFFERLTKASRLYENNAPEFLRTHPVTTNRVAEAIDRAERYGYRQRPDSLRFHLTRADLRQRSYRSPEKAVRHFEATLRDKRYRNQMAEHYGYALAMARAGRLDEASREAKSLLDFKPTQAEFVVLAAIVKRRQGNMDTALQRLKQAVSLSPNSWPLRMAYGELLMDAARWADAADQLDRVAKARPRNTKVFLLLADAAGKAGRKTSVHRYRAEYYALIGEIEPAIRQLEIALRNTRPSYHDASRIQVRLQELETEMRDTKERKKR